MTEAQMVSNLLTGIFFGVILIAGAFAYNYYRKEKARDKREQEEAEKNYKQWVEREEVKRIKASNYQKGWYRRRKYQKVQTGQEFLAENQFVIEIEDEAEHQKPLQVWTAPEKLTPVRKRSRKFSDLTGGEKILLLAAGLAAGFVLYTLIKKRK